jgi:hypothetical protein
MQRIRNGARGGRAAKRSKTTRQTYLVSPRGLQGSAKEWSAPNAPTKRSEG